MGNEGALLAYLFAGFVIVAGLFSSTAHLGHPERAWRALSQWRSSWLSREGVVAVLTFLPLFMLVVSLFFQNFLSFSAALIAGILSLVTVFCTSMIYGSLKTVPAWNTSLTPMAFFGFSLSGGLLALVVFQQVFAEQTGTGAVVAASYVLIGTWLIKFGWWKRAAKVMASTAESATGLGTLGKVRLLERPHVEANYLTREMGYKVARKHARKLRILSVLLGGILPFLLLLALLAFEGRTGLFLSLIALLSHVAGILAERWLFFAEAKHVVTLYYGAEKV